MERKYSIIITPPQEISEGIKKRARRVSKHINLVPHISLCTSISPIRNDFIERISDYLEKEEPFIFTLRKVGIYSHRLSETVYLTSYDKDEIKKLTDLYSGIKSSLRGAGKIGGGKSFYFPHLTLDYFPNFNKAEKAKYQYEGLFRNPIPLLIEEIEVSQKIENRRWETIEYLKIGKQREVSLLPTEIYSFGDNGRASI